MNKVEGLIQLYDKVAIDFITPQGLTAYFKKNELPPFGRPQIPRKSNEVGCVFGKELRSRITL